MALVRDELSFIVRKALQDVFGIAEDFEPELEIPSLAQHGDYATNAAMVLAKSLKKNPREIAEKLSEPITSLGANILDRLEIAGPGFINFFIKKEAFRQVLPMVFEQGENFGKTDVGKGRFVQVEFVSANPTGTFTCRSWPWRCRGRCARPDSRSQWLQSAPGILHKRRW